MMMMPPTRLWMVVKDISGVVVMDQGRTVTHQEVSPTTKNQDPSVLLATTTKSWLFLLETC